VDAASAPVIVIDAFEVPPDQDDAFLAAWKGRAIS
jgi:hypothetical protein